jgi:hypothetical protein
MFARKLLKSYGQALEAVQSARFRRLVPDTMEHFGRCDYACTPRIVGRIYAAGQLSQRRKTIRRLGARIEILNPEQLHPLRIQVKKARYSIEFFSGLFHGKECANRCKTIKSFLVKLQDSLGKLNDIVTHKTLFGDIIARPTKGLTGKQNHHRAFAAGPIIGDQQAKVQKSLDRARKAYSRFDRAKAFWKVTDPKQHVQASSVQESTEQ